MLDKESYTSKEINDWDQLIEFYNKLTSTDDQWIFRGQRDNNWPLKTSLERATRSFGIDYRDIPKYERGLLRKFKRQCHHYTSNVPNDDNTMEWLALMQHYGTPTRLLDWTYSFFVALYFALEDTNWDPEKNKFACAVWALNTDWMPEKIKPLLGDDVWKCFIEDENITNSNTFNKVLAREDPIAMVLAINPFRLNEKLTIQQGVFLCPGDVSQSFESNLATLLSESSSKDNFIKCTITGDLEIKKQMLNNLHRMNVNAATLFPGLEGFARSLKTLLAFPSTITPKD